MNFVWKIYKVQEVHTECVSFKEIPHQVSGVHVECMDFLWIEAKFQECVWSAWILVCKWSPGSVFGVRTFQQKKMWECVGVRWSALKDSRVCLECALLTHCYALQTHFSTARVSILINSLLIFSGRMSLNQSNEQVDYMFYLLMALFSWNMTRQQLVMCNSLGGELGGRWHDPPVLWTVFLPQDVVC